MNFLIHDIEKMVEGVFEIQFACEILKLISDSEPGYAPLNAENSLSVILASFLPMHMRKYSRFCFEHYFLSFPRR